LAVSDREAERHATEQAQYHAEPEALARDFAQFTLDDLLLPDCPALVKPSVSI